SFACAGTPPPLSSDASPDRPAPARPEPRPAPAVPATAGVAGALFGLLLALVAVEWAPLMSLDHTVADRLHRVAHAHPGWTRANRVLTDWVWDPWAMRALTALTVGVLLWRGARRTALWLGAWAIGAGLVQQLFKWLVDRARPTWPEPLDTANFAAFPSGHAMTAAFTCCLLLCLVPARGTRGTSARHGTTARRGTPGQRGATAVRGGRGPWWAAAAGLAVVSVLGVGFTRVYLGVHWFTDVLGGWLLGVALAAAALWWRPGRRAGGPLPGPRRP
ncbi:phosphatase PAP2 family protein, partial [Streptomyces sp. URMC 123]|uniref:phosphatase PAP2 family protein n=1 Tax=Streptomyces sp. URMC 123 TaxID=3423403 RepID=UPI003F1A6973